MKINYLLAVLAITIVSCKEDIIDNRSDISFFNIENCNYLFDNSNKTQKLNIISNQDWTIEIDESIDWIHFDTLRGNGNANVDITVNTNESDERTASFIVKADKEIKCSIKQVKGDAFKSISFIRETALKDRENGIVTEQYNWYIKGCIINKESNNNAIIMDRLEANSGVVIECNNIQGEIGDTIALGLRNTNFDKSGNLIIKPENTWLIEPDEKKLTYIELPSDFNLGNYESMLVRINNTQVSYNENIGNESWNECFPVEMEVNGKVNVYKIDKLNASEDFNSILPSASGNVSGIVKNDGEEYKLFVRNNNDISSLTYKRFGNEIPIKFGTARIEGNITQGIETKDAHVIIPYAFGANEQCVISDIEITGNGSKGLSISGTSTTLENEDGEIRIPITGTPNNNGDITISLKINEETVTIESNVESTGTFKIVSISQKGVFKVGIQNNEDCKIVINYACGYGQTYSTSITFKEGSGLNNITNEDKKFDGVNGLIEIPITGTPLKEGNISVTIQIGEATYNGTIKVVKDYEIAVWNFVCGSSQILEVPFKATDNQSEITLFGGATQEGLVTTGFSLENQLLARGWKNKENWLGSKEISGWEFSIPVTNFEAGNIKIISRYCSSNVRAPQNWEFMYTIGNNNDFIKVNNFKYETENIPVYNVAFLNTQDIEFTINIPQNIPSGILKLRLVQKSLSTNTGTQTDQSGFHKYFKVIKTY